MENENVKKTMGRRKIEIKKIQKKTSLQATFTKRRSGIFRKASELSILCGAEVAILVQSPANKIFAFGHPTVGTLIDRATSATNSRGITPQCDDSRRKYEEAVKALEREEIMRREREKGVWWEKPIEGLELHELEGFLVGLDALRENINRKLEVEELSTGFIENGIASNGEVEQGELLVGSEGLLRENVNQEEEFWDGLEGLGESMEEFERLLQMSSHSHPSIQPYQQRNLIINSS